MNETICIGCTWLWRAGVATFVVLFLIQLFFGRNRDIYRFQFVMLPAAVLLIRSIDPFGCFVFSMLMIELFRDVAVPFILFMISRVFLHQLQESFTLLKIQPPAFFAFFPVIVLICLCVFSCLTFLLFWMFGFSPFDIILNTVVVFWLLFLLIVHAYATLRMFRLLSSVFPSLSQASWHTTSPAPHASLNNPASTTVTITPGASPMHWTMNSHNLMSWNSAPVAVTTHCELLSLFFFA